MKNKLPIGMRQILEVYRLVYQLGYERTDAVKKVALVCRVTSQTISSAITRNIGINTSQLDNLMRKGNEDAFRQHLVRHFPNYQDDIEKFFTSVNESTEYVEKGPTRILRTLFPEEKLNVLNLILLDEVRKYLKQWLARTDIPEDLREEIRDIKTKLGDG